MSAPSVGNAKITFGRVYRDTVDARYFEVFVDGEVVGAATLREYLDGAPYHFSADWDGPLGKIGWEAEHDFPCAMTKADSLWIIRRALRGKEVVR